MDEPTPPPPRRRKGHLPTWVSVLTLALLFAGLGVAWYVASQPKNGIRFEDFAAEARRDLPVGTATKDQVLAWFAGHGITDYGDLLDTGGNKAGYACQVPNDTWLDQADIVMLCRCDKDGKLVDLSISRIRKR